MIDLIVQGKNAEASDVLNSELLDRSYAAISELRPHVAADYFQAVADSTLEQDEPSEEPTTEEPTDETN